MMKNDSTPGVYIEERDAFSNSVVPVATAVPCFIGFTEIALRDEKLLFDQLVKISSFDEFTRYFGGPPMITYEVVLDDPNLPDEITINPDFNTQFYLYYSLKLYFNNGGGDCYIYSTGAYQKKDGSGSNRMDANMVKEALEALAKEPEPTLIVIPDGHTAALASDYYSFWKSVLPECKRMINRFAILDIHGGGDVNNLENSADITTLIKAFKDGIGTENLNYGAVYWPWVQASVVQSSDLDFRNISNLRVIQTKIKRNAIDRFPNLPDGRTDERATQIEKLVNQLGQVIKEETPTNAIENTTDEATFSRQHNALYQVSPIYKAVMMRLREVANILPPSAAMAGVYKSVDASIGTHQAPANISLISVIKPMVNIDDREQEDLNIPIDGKAINAIRAFPGKGVLVWGARTMDGNSRDWRYISVRRTVSMIELSIKYAAEAFVFEPNVSSTWSNLKAMISNFLTNMWYAGALAGATPESSFSVDVGLGTTMTAVDILDGYMRVSVQIAVTRPAEFIVITFEQQMQTS